ncbi:MAG TPA: hypothetical protein VGF23_13000 [Gaiellaceae bacterium]
MSAGPQSAVLGVQRNELFRRLGAAYRWLEGVRPIHVLVPLLLLQWLAVLALALTVRHNGWTWYQGGDQLWYYGGAWLFSHGQVPYPQTGPGWPVLLAPVARIAGPNTAAAFPAIILFDLLVLLPVALLCIYGIGRRLGGRVFGYWAALVWIAVPYIGIKYTNTGYHQKFTELTLPQSLGLTAMADFPSMVLILVGAYLVVRALDSDDRLTAAAAGFAAGFGAIAIKPSNAIFLIGPALAFLYRRRWTGLTVFAAGLLPSIALLVLWKYRGFGYLPAFHSSLEPTRRVAAPVGDVFAPVHKYVHLNWHQLHKNLLGIREHFWSARVIEWLVLAGLLGVLRRSFTLFLLIGGWFAAFVILKGTYSHGSVEDTSVFRIMMPAFPAFILLLASLPLLVPGLPKRLPTSVDAFRLTRRMRLGLLGAAVVVLGALPLAAIAASSPTGPNPKLVVITGNAPATVDSGLDLSVRRVGSDVVARWRPFKPAGTRVVYRLLRTPTDKAAPVCDAGQRSPRCTLNLEFRPATRGTSIRDHADPGRWTYRVGVVVNWVADPNFGDIYALSPPVDVVVP